MQTRERVRRAAELESKASHSWEEKDVGGIVVLLQHENGGVDVGQWDALKVSFFEGEICGLVLGSRR